MQSFFLFMQQFFKLSKQLVQGSRFKNQAKHSGIIVFWICFFYLRSAQLVINMIRYDCMIRYDMIASMIGDMIANMIGYDMIPRIKTHDSEKFEASLLGTW